LTNGSFTFPQFEALRTQRLFGDTVAISDDRFQVEIAGSARIANATLASGEYFTSLGVNAALGRTIGAEDERTQAPVAVLDHTFWQRVFSSNPEIIGQTLRVNGVAVTIIGITPPEFKGVVVGRPADFTLPITLYPRLRPERSGILTRRSAYWLNIMARLQPNQTVDLANARLKVVWPQVLAATAPPDTPSNSNYFQKKTDLEPARNGFSPLRRVYTSPLYILMGLVGLVLLVACANIANLLIARGAARHHEFVIRQSVGAGRSRLIRQLLTESLLLATFGGIAGSVLAIWMVRNLVAFISSSSNPISLDFSLDGRVLAFSVGLTILSAVLFGLAPALRGSRVDLATGLKESARGVAGGGHLRKILVVAQMALSMVLAVGSGLFLNSLRHLLAVDMGFVPTHVLLLKANAITAGYRGDRATQFFTDFKERVSTIPGVQLTGLAWAPPVSQGFGNNGQISVEGRPPLPGPDRVVWSNFVSPQYLETIGQRLLAGRDFTNRDRPNSPRVAIVNQTMARHFFGSESPVGKRIDTSGGTKFDCEIVGVVQDAIHFDLKEKPQRVFYMPYTQGPEFLKSENMLLAARVSLPHSSAINQLRDAVLGIDRNVIAEIVPLQTHIEGTFARERLLATLSGFLGGLSVLLVAIGLYGVMAWSVTRRTSEIGVRIALGAQPGSVMYMVLRESLTLVAVGTALGVSVALALSRVVASLLFGVTPRDALAIGGAVAIMTVVATVATLLPAIRAARVDPLVALRYE
jgi:predicted permease